MDKILFLKWLENEAIDLKTDFEECKSKDISFNSQIATYIHVSERIKFITKIREAMEAGAFD
jgi:hypothetical protein